MFWYFSGLHSKQLTGTLLLAPRATVNCSTKINSFISRLELLYWDSKRCSCLLFWSRGDITHSIWAHKKERDYSNEACILSTQYINLMARWIVLSMHEITHIKVAFGDKWEVCNLEPWSSCCLCYIVIYCSFFPFIKFMPFKNSIISHKLSQFIITSLVWVIKNNSVTLATPSVICKYWITEQVLLYW